MLVASGQSCEACWKSHAAVKSQQHVSVHDMSVPCVFKLLNYDPVHPPTLAYYRVQLAW